MAEHDLNSVAFPTLGEDQLSRLASCPVTRLRRFSAGEMVFVASAHDTKFFVVKSGAIEILDESGDSTQLVAVHGPGHFTGEISQFAGGHAIVSGRAVRDSEAYEISTESMREILNLHPALGDIFLQAFIARRQLLRDSGSFTGLRVIGSRYSQDTFRVRDFLARNRALFTWMDLEDDPAVASLLTQFHLTEADTPVVSCGSAVLLRNPTDRELAEAIGIRQPLSQEVYDLAVAGSGPAGLAAAVYGASEGLSTIVLERSGPGGQAGRSMRIENYLGFPTGITGGELAERAVVQAGKFGAKLPVPTPVTRLTFENGYSILHIEGGETITAKCLLIATGAEYRKMDVEGCEPFEGRGVYYAATPNEARICQGAEVLVVGGGNSAGQAAVFLSGQATKVYLVIRGADIDKHMSSYLARRIEQTRNIEVLVDTEVHCMRGDGHLGEVDLIGRATREKRTIVSPALFSFIGATPRTDWVPPEVERDAKGFVRTGPGLESSPHWPLKRQPFLLETSKPGVFASGDVRSGSVKRVASAVGEGSMAVQFVHEYLKEM